MTLAVIGIGRWGRNIVQTLETIPEVNLKYLCNSIIETLAPFPETYIKLSDWHDLLTKEDIDGVIIATPPPTHGMIATTFLERGFPVFVEKPMVLSVAIAEKLRNSAKKSGQVFMVGYQYIYNDNINYLKKEMDDGFFGEIIEIKSEHRVSTQRPDVDILWDAGPHPLSIFQYFFTPGKMTSVTGKVEHGLVSIEVDFENAPKLKIDASFSGEKKTRMLTIVGEKATAVVDETLKKGQLTILKNGQVIRPKIDSEAPLRAELKHFIKCIQTDATPITDIDFGYTITKMLEDISFSQSR